MVDFKKLSMLSNISRDIVDKEHPSFDENRKRVFCLGFLGGFNYSEKNPDANRETIDSVSRDSMNRSNPWYEEYEKETYLLGFNRGYSYVANDEARHYRQYMENPFSDQIGLGEATPDYDSADAAGLGVQFPILLKGTIIGWLPVDAVYDKDKPNHLISDDSHYLRMSSVGDSTEIKKEYRGQGYGKAAYYELAVKAARMGMVLCSAPDSSRSENANRLWKSLVSSGYARQNGDRYEFINSKIIVTNKAVGGIQKASKTMNKSLTQNEKQMISQVATDLVTGNHLLGRSRPDGYKELMREVGNAFAAVKSFSVTSRQRDILSELIENYHDGYEEVASQIGVDVPLLKAALSNDNTAREKYVNVLRQQVKQAIHDRIVTPSARSFTPDQVKNLNRYHEVVSPNTPAGEVFRDLLQEVAQDPDVASKPEKWVADTAKELDDLAEGITRGQDRGLHK